MSDTRPNSMQQIADALGVSRATVSNALRGTGRVGRDLAERIRAEAARSGYVPSHAGRSLRTGKSANIGLVVPDFAMPLFPVFAQAFERAAKRRGMAIMVADSMGAAETQREEIRNIVARGVDGLVVIPLRGSNLADLALPVPMAVVDSAANPLNAASCDHRDGGRQVARHLADLGHRRVVILVSAEESTVSAERQRGMEEVFRIRDVRWKVVALRPDFDSVHDWAMGADLTGDLGGATACAAAYDAAAVGFAAAMAARGLRVPQDISITGFDDLIWGRILSPALTTVRQDLAAIAEQALAVLADGAAPGRIFPVTLVARGSSGPAPHS
ncbi:LacI family DNA-binding transcriptional regulator [Plastorhodobacter daqingensis]|uniref:LacI family DNA-binding transcriptional regulator n=1 Tax=Plastorhodobacter daqingensis TaxID=1387281 RepID=A0ABW2UM21_9RHOB